MRQSILVLTSGLLALVYSAPVQAESDYENTAVTPEQMQAASQQLGAAFAGFGQAMAQAMGAAAGAQSGAVAQTVDFRDLKGLLKDKLGPLTLVKKSGERNATMGFNISFAEGEYRSAEGERVQVKITDMGSMKDFGNMAYAWNVEVDREWDTGFERTFRLKSKYQAREEFDSERAYGELSALAAEGRFHVEFSGKTNDIKQWHKAADDIDFNQLDNWKQYGLAQ